MNNCQQYLRQRKTDWSYGVKKLNQCMFGLIVQVSSSEPSLVNEVQGIDAVFLTRHSQDPHLCESPQANVENTLLLEAGPNMASIIILTSE